MISRPAWSPVSKSVNLGPCHTLLLNPVKSRQSYYAPIPESRVFETGATSHACL